MEWNTVYPVAQSSWGPCTNCDIPKVVEVSDPSGTKTRHTFGTLFQKTEGELQSTTVIGSDNTVLRTTAMRYAEPVGPRGVSEQSRGDGSQAARVREVDQRITTQQGVDFTWEALSFNTDFAQVTQVRKSSGAPLNASRTENMEYNNNVTKWVLGQVAKVTELSTGRIPVFNVYDATNASLTSVSKFGKLEQSMTYHPDGTLATRTDGANHITRFNSYKRGVPQSVVYANTTSESAVVNDLGLITATTNAVNFTTTYGYDAMGRLDLITPPVSGPQAWNPTTISYVKSSAPKLDLPAGYWRQEVKTGNNHTFTHYDAFWRPVYTEQWDNADAANTRKIVKHGYDFGGRKTYESYPKRVDADIGYGIRYAFDGLGRPTVTETDSELGKLYTTNT